MIDQDTTVSRQISLWDQHGSRVLRGNLLVIPVGDAFLYVEPVYLEAEGDALPQLKRVIVSDGERLAMEPTLEEALRAAFGGAGREGEGAGEPLATAGLGQARGALAAAEAALRAGDWARFGAAMQELKRLLGSAPEDAPAAADTSSSSAGRASSAGISRRTWPGTAGPCASRPGPVAAPPPLARVGLSRRPPPTFATRTGCARPCVAPRSSSTSWASAGSGARASRRCTSRARRGSPGSPPRPWRRVSCTSRRSASPRTRPRRPTAPRPGARRRCG